ncbi:hypothetical protein LTR20_001644 [Exophiala xenobiotica]|nr:hypothetical protein LTS13_006355 [Exophiala xenobiotica]KAK5393705.1 hypothetical protein LTR79_008648 [Exophiala xenobiotica]KAK5414883.1 hypothetical protein LTR90_005929 [Exophiala xenobiotica]KAK5471379.1 hypothetical protein LTR20_001644 [Exophiala xenobiotica]KAK5489341.1 hypothetical protein LTR26_004660 [Exophiala xenobiotica]
MKPSVVRILCVAAVVVASALAIFFSISYVAIPLFVWLSPSLNPTLYDWGFYGACPLQTFVSSDLVVPRVSTARSHSDCDNGFVFLTVGGASTGPTGPTILNSDNELVWKSESYAVTTNLQVQRYKGQDYLTFWSGKKLGTKGVGVYYLLDASYNVAHQVSAVGDDLQGDLHEFKITKDDTALLTVYTTKEADLSSLGKRTNGWILDSLFQEVDIATGELLFEWRASEHFNVTEGYTTNPFGGYIRSMPFDFFHINSVDKDAQGNYIISSRHTHTVTCISPGGEIVWILGGQRNQFTDLSGGDALDFKWQHDARWVSEEEGILSLFDNKEAGILHVDGPYSRGMMLQLDIANRTVDLLHSYVSLGQTRAPSQGSMQVIPNSDHVFVGWGHSPVFSEFLPNGTLLCEHHFGSPMYHAWNRAVSYRAFRGEKWVGRPTEPPSAEIEDEVLYVSWNGATEVSAWMLQGAKSAEDEEIFTDLDILDKDSFEEAFELNNLSEYIRFRVVALDKSGQVLGQSDVVTHKPERGWGSFVLAVVAWAVIARVAWYSYKWLARQRGTGIAWKTFGNKQ